MSALPLPDTSGTASSSAPVLLPPDPRHGWRRRETAAGTLHTAGDVAVDAALMSLLAVGRMPDATALAAAVKPVRACWAALVTGPDGVAAAVDHIRSLPLFHADGPNGVFVGDDARTVAAAAGKSNLDPVAAEELALAGYATGNRTLLQGLVQLVAGEVRVWRRDGASGRALHHEFSPATDEAAPSVETDELGAALDAAFDRLIAGARGRPVWVPLSGGLDSRLVLAKLVERSYRPLVAFSYGPRGNSDAVVAQAVARRLGVDWLFVDTPGTDVRAYFSSQARRDYWGFCDGLCSVPNMQDVHPLAAMRTRGVLPADALIVNGQTGDFISGAHIPARLLAQVQVSPEVLLDAIIDKHFALWRPLLDSRRRAALRRRIGDALALDPDGADMPRAAATSGFERFEFAERQAKFVVNGQRAYEWHGLGWGLPLWDRDIVELFARAPLGQRRDQTLYRRYLDDWDYRSAFSGVTRKVTGWSPAAQAVVTPLAIALRLLVGRARRDRLVGYLNYWDRFGAQYAAFGFRAYARHREALRNPVSLYARAWLAEQNIDPDTL